MSVQERNLESADDQIYSSHRELLFGVNSDDISTYLKELFETHKACDNVTYHKLDVIF